MRIGSTGTQKGTSLRQKLWFLYQVNKQVEAALIRGDSMFEYHHGDCIGSDDEFHDIIRQFFPFIRIIGHPGVDKHGNSPKRAYKACDELREPQYYTDRNKSIVDNVNVIFAAPETDQEVLRSGTWQTIRYAQSVNKEPLILKR